MPHTGTTTLHSLLLLLGCCFATHNFPTGFTSAAAVALRHLCAANTTSAACADALLTEADSWQCLSDNPWAEHWRLLVAHAPRGTRFVLTRFADPLAFGISRLLGGVSERRAREWALASWAPGSKVDKLLRSHARAYHEHVRDVRAALADTSRLYAEVCWACGDNASTLVAKLRLPQAEANEGGDGGTTTLPPTPTHKHSGAERHRVARLLRKRVLDAKAACDERQGSAWMCEE